MKLGMLKLYSEFFFGKWMCRTFEGHNGKLLCWFRCDFRSEIANVVMFEELLAFVDFVILIFFFMLNMKFQCKIQILFERVQEKCNL